MKNIKTKKIDIDSKLYPELLKEIADPPKVLYCRGNEELLSTLSVSVVGSRVATDYGVWAAFSLGELVGGNGVTVVSGMAEGIDSKAHEGALKSNGNTIAVLGNGTDICYPRMNQGLYESIIKNGLIISEYPDGMKARRYTFPMRNRIISGISTTTVVVEAGLKSGSLITAELANEQSRMVYAVPGNMNRKTSFGCNKLIADGAGILVTFDDVLTSLGVEIACKEDEYKDLSQLEKDMISHVRSSSETTVDQLSVRAKLPASKVMGIITVLEMKGHVKTAGGKIFIEK